MLGLQCSFLLAVGNCSVGPDVRAFAQPAEPKCDWPAFERSAANLRAARDAAMKISEDQGNTEVPPEAIKEIQAFKNALFDSLQVYFRCQPTALPDPKALESDLYSRFQIPVPQPPDPLAVANPDDNGPWMGLYLGDISISVLTVHDSRHLVAVRTSFGIPYGADAELDVFAPDKDGRWSAVINLTSKPYKSIAGAFLAFDYKISRPNPKGDWFVVATHINPCPTSCWQDLFTDAVRPQDFGFEYQLFHDEQYGYICTDDAPYLRSVASDGFQTRFNIDSIDESQLNTASLKTYKIMGDEVVRVQPVALNPVNFADEWVRTKWREARDWSDSQSIAQLRLSHQKLHDSRGDFASFRACTTLGRSQVEFDEFVNGSDGPTWYFLVRKTGDDYTMLRVSQHPDPSCKGPDRLGSIKDR